MHLQHSQDIGVTSDTNVADDTSAFLNHIVVVGISRDRRILAPQWQAPQYRRRKNHKTQDAFRRSPHRMYPYEL